MTDIFDSVQKVVPPPATTVQYVWPTNQEYMGSLASLQTAVSQVAEAPATPGAPDPNRGLPVRQSADNARNVVKKLGYTFKINPESHMEMVTSTKLLEAPIEYADALTKGMGAGEINAKAGPILRESFGESQKVPVQSVRNGRSLDAGAGMRIFRPGEGRLWTF